MRKPNCKCTQCQIDIYRRPFQIRKGDVFRSTKCSNVRKKTPDVICFCGNVVDKSRRAKYCSKSCANEAIKLFVRKPRAKSNGKYALKHFRVHLINERGGKCNRCDFSIAGILQIHHIIERCNGGTDEFSNLEILCPNCHALHHYELNRKVGREA